MPDPRPKRRAKKQEDIVLLIVEAPRGKFFYAWGGRNVPAKTAKKINAYKTGKATDARVTLSPFGLIAIPDNDIINILGDLKPPRPRPPRRG